MSLAEDRTRYFYDWELRGRGWKAYGKPVALEPPFEPFHPPVQAQVADEALAPMPITQLLRRLGSLFSRKPKPVERKEITPDAEPRRADDAPRRILRISLPRSLDLEGYEAERLLLMLCPCRFPVSFEIVADGASVSVQVVCREPDLPYVLSQVGTFYPSCSVAQAEDALAGVADRPSAAVLDFGLAEEFMRPLSLYDDRNPSPYLGLLGTLSTLTPGETACIQVLFKGTTAPWPASIQRSVSDGQGRSFFADAPEMPKLAAEKVSSQLFAACVRLLTAANTETRNDELLRQLSGGLSHQTSSAHNSLVPLSGGYADPYDHLHDFLARWSRRPGMLLNTGELASLVHLPSDAFSVRRLTSERRTTKELSASALGHPLVLGRNDHMGRQAAASASDEQRFTHTHVIGATGTGKSTFLLNCIAQDVRLGNGLAVLDPHGDLVDAVLGRIPKDRLNDVVLIDPSDPEYAVGFNVLGAASELEKEVLSSDLVAMFQRFSTSWGDQMSSVLANALLAFLENPRGGTLPDVRRFLLEPSFRKEVLGTVADPGIGYYWRHEYPLVKGGAVGSILTRLDSFLRPKAVRCMVGQREGVNIGGAMDSGKILLVKLSHGLIGESNSYLLGSLILSKIYQSALARQAVPQERRRPFFVYVDEFQHFVMPSLSHMLSGGRKYRLGLTLAHQSLDQVAKADAELMSSVIANAGIRVCFRLGEGDAQKMAKGFASFDEADLATLGTGQAVCRIGQADRDFSLSVPRDISDQWDGYAASAEVVEASRARYGVLRSKIEEELNLSASREHLAVHQEKQSEETTGTEDISIRPVEQVQKLEEQTATKEEKPADSEEVKVINDPALAENMVRRREESRHRYLQMLIKRNAESRGFKATIEQATKDGQGHVDVVLQKGKLTYAIEIGVTTSKDWECHNIEKCLADGYENVIALSEDERGTALMSRKLREHGLLPAHGDRVRVCDLVSFMALLDKEEATGKAAPKTKTIKGYRVKVEYVDDDGFTKKS